MTRSEPVTLIIADDHKLFAEALEIALSCQEVFPVQILEKAHNGEELLELLVSMQPEILLLDLNMPIKNGLEVIPVIKEHYPDIQIIIVTMYQDAKFVKECIQIHRVAAYVLKTSGFGELIEGIKAVANGGTYMSKDLQLFPKDFDYQDIETVFEESFLTRYNLTRREIEILGWIAQAKTSSDIAELLFISPQTVSAHRKNIMRKLSITTTAGLVRFAMQNQMG